MCYDVVFCCVFVSLSSLLCISCVFTGFEGYIFIVIHSLSNNCIYMYYCLYYLYICYFVVIIGFQGSRFGFRV